MDINRRTGVAERLPMTSGEGSLRPLDPVDEKPQGRIGRAEVLVAVWAFAALCVAVLTRTAQLLEPDDFAYRASIIALTRGHLSLTNEQYQSLLKELSNGGGQGIAQWVQTAGGSWISEKNPGYPFLAAPFQALGMLRVARCSMERWGAWDCSPAPGAGSGAGVARGRSSCSAARERPWSSPGGPRCPPSPTPR